MSKRKAASQDTNGETKPRKKTQARKEDKETQAEKARDKEADIAGDPDSQADPQDSTGSHASSSALGKPASSHGGVESTNRSDLRNYGGSHHSAHARNPESTDEKTGDLQHDSGSRSAPNMRNVRNAASQRRARGHGTGKGAQKKIEIIRKDAFSLTIKKIKPKKTIYLKGFSEDGLRLGKDKDDGRKGSLYMRMEKVTSVDAKDTLKNFLEEVDTTTDAIWNTYQDDIYNEFGLDKESSFFSVVYRNGWQQWVEENYNESKDKKTEKVLYPHPKYSKLAKIKNGKLQPLKTSLNSQVDRLANSDWTIKIGISSVAVEYNEKARKMILFPYYSVDLMAYIDEGQNTILDQDRMQELEEEREKAQFNELLLVAADLYLHSTK